MLVINNGDDYNDSSYEHVEVNQSNEIYLLERCYLYSSLHHSIKTVFAVRRFHLCQNAFRKLLLVTVMIMM